jgi:3-isopropylmalate/(R)-2-methylmalate dehydratase large subunit
MEKPVSHQHARTLIDKIWDQHAIVTREDGQSLLFIDRHLLHEGSFHAFDQLAKRKVPLIRPDLTFGIADHYVPTRNHAQTAPEIQNMIDQLSHNCTKHGVTLFGLADHRQGIVHVTVPAQGLTLPGTTIVCGDSHTSTHGAFGAYAFGIGASEVAHVMMTQTLWQKKPKRMRITFHGVLPDGCSAKDIALNMIATIGTDGAQGHAIEYAGEAIRSLSMEGRLTLCNLSIEAGARLGLIAPDETTFAFLKGRPFTPKGTAFEQAITDWRQLTSDEDAVFDKEISIDVNDLAPILTWGTTPEQALPVTARLPDPSASPNPQHAAMLKDALSYMGLDPGKPLEGIKIDRVFIGSCTNSRIEDLRLAAQILQHGVAQIPGLVSPGSFAVKQQAEQEGLDQIFIKAGLEWVDPGCSMCVGMNGDQVPAGERCASTTNRNFKGRQGPGSRTHLMSPAMVAAAALTGHITDVRRYLKKA